VENDSPTQPWFKHNIEERVLALEKKLSIAGFGNTLFTQMANVTVGNTIAETTLVDSGIGSLLLPANFFVPGRNLTIIGRGFHSASGNPDITINIKLGTTLILTTGAAKCGTDDNDGFEVNGFITCRTAGINGLLAAQGTYLEHGSGLSGMINLTTTVINTTISQLIDITVQWGTQASGNTITMTNLIVQAGTLGQ